MTIVQTAIDDLLESNMKYPPYGHDVIFYFNKNKKEAIYISGGFSDNYPIHIYFEKDDLLVDQIDKLKKIKLKFSEQPYFEEYKSVRIDANLELDKDYIEELVINLFREVWNIDDISKLKYDINPV